MTKRPPYHSAFWPLDLATALRVLRLSDEEREHLKTMCIIALIPPEPTRGRFQEWGWVYTTSGNAQVGKPGVLAYEHLLALYDNEEPGSLAERRWDVRGEYV